MMRFVENPVSIPRLIVIIVFIGIFGLYLASWLYKHGSQGLPPLLAIIILISHSA